MFDPVVFSIVIFWEGLLWLRVALPPVVQVYSSRGCYMPVCAALREDCGCLATDCNGSTDILYHGSVQIFMLIYLVSWWRVLLIRTCLCFLHVSLFCYVFVYLGCVLLTLVGEGGHSGTVGGKETMSLQLCLIIHWLTDWQINDWSTHCTCSHPITARPEVVVQPVYPYTPSPLGPACGPAPLVLAEEYMVIL